MTRRELLAVSLSSPLLGARHRIDPSRIGAITDEIARTSADAIRFAHQYGLKWIELRRVPEARGEYAFLSEEELRPHAKAIRDAGLRVSFLNTSLLKFVWPGMQPERPRRLGKDSLESRLQTESARFDRRMEDLGKALRAAHLFGVDKVRVFCGVRAVDPGKQYGRIADVIGEMTKVAEKERVRLLVENEASCNIATSTELATLMKMIPSRWLGINWDPLNELHQQDVPFPDGYNRLPKQRLGNVQIKGKSVLDPAEKLDWAAIFASLARDGYRGQVGLETHYFDGTLIEKSHLAIREILRISKEA